MTRAADLIVEILDAEPDALSVRELAKRTQRHDGNIRRVLGQLRKDGIVDRVPSAGREALWYRTNRPAPAPRKPTGPEPMCRFPPELYARLQAEAQRTGRPIKRVAADLLAAHLPEIKESPAA